MDGQVTTPLPDSAGSIEESLLGLSDNNKYHRLRQLKGRFLMKMKRMVAHPIEDNHAKRALRTLAEMHGTSVKSLRRRKRYRSVYNEWKDIYSV